MPIQKQSKNEKEMNGKPSDNGAECFPEVDILDLLVSAKNDECFMFVYFACCNMMLAFHGPDGW